MRRLFKRLFKRKKVNYNDLSLAIGLVFGRYFFKTDYLHYGYWPPDLPVTAANLAEAQAHYNRLLMAQIPSDARTVLDVGCGSGRFARELIDRGHRVDAVSPSPSLTRAARPLVGEGNTIFECRFEDLQTDKRYDVILFSESFQYVDGIGALPKLSGLLADAGRVVICDFFRKHTGPSAFGGGHVLERFYERVEQHGFTIVVDQDITPQVAPTLDLADDFLNAVVLPVSGLVADFLARNFPALFKILRWRFRKKIRKFERKYLNGARSGKSFAESKSYRLFVLQRTNVPGG